MIETERFFVDGQAYERLMGRWSRAVGDIFLDWLSLPNGLNWLDVGCGTGVFTELVIERVAPFQVCAIDPATDQIAYARTRPIAAGVDFRVGDALSLSFSDQEFDVAVMALVITFLPDPAKAVAEMKRVVRPGGLVATYIWDSVGGGYTQQPLRDAIREVTGNAPDLLHASNSTLANLNRFFETAGLESISTRTIEIMVSYANFEEYL